MTYGALKAALSKIAIDVDTPDMARAVERLDAERGWRSDRGDLTELLRVHLYVGEFPRERLMEQLRSDLALLEAVGEPIPALFRNHERVPPPMSNEELIIFVRGAQLAVRRAEMRRTPAAIGSPEPEGAPDPVPAGGGHASEPGASPSATASQPRP